MRSLSMVAALIMGVLPIAVYTTWDLVRMWSPIAPGEIHPVALSERFNTRVPHDFVSRFRTIAAEVDAALQVRRAAVLAGFHADMRSFWTYIASGLALVTRACCCCRLPAFTR